jgi:hypothetical protein
MPVTTIIRPEFAQTISGIIEGLTNEQVTVRTGISSEYIRKMRSGLVPSEAIIGRFYEGLKDRGADLTKLRIAAGYEQSTDPIVAFKTAIALKEGVSQEQLDKVPKEEFERIAQIVSSELRKSGIIK